MNTFTLAQLQKLGSEEQLIQSLVGKVSERLTLPKGTMPFMRDKERLIEAGNIVIDYIQAGCITERKEKFEKDGKWTTLTHVRIIGGKSKVVSTTAGIELMPSVVHQKAVRANALKTPDKDVLRMLSSIKLQRSEFATAQYMTEVQALAPIDPLSPETPFMRDGRRAEYIKTAQELGDFYLSYKYDGRGRMGPESGNLEGLRAHGKAVETMAFEVTPRELTDDGRKLLETIQAHGYPELIGKLRNPQITKALNTGKTGMLTEFDVSNNGLYLAGILFGSITMLTNNNGYGNTTRVDSHGIVAIKYGCTRDEAKEINMLLLHGGSYGSLVKMLLRITGRIYSKDEVRDHAYEAYGKCVDNIQSIAAYGRDIMSNTRSTVGWTMPDGFHAVHRAYTEQVPLDLKLNGRNMKVVRSMPLLLDGSGFPVYGPKTPRCTEKTVTHMMGLYADIIHSVDSYVMRQVIRSGIELIPKHDAFIIHPNDEARLSLILRETFRDLQDSDLLSNILGQIEKTTGVKAPEMLYGDAENRMMESFLFLKAE